MSREESRHRDPTLNTVYLALPLLGAAAAAIGGWIGYSAFFINHRRELRPALGGERRTFASRGAGVLSYYVERRARERPLVLIHSINAAGTAFEVRPIFDHYREQRPVYALDLPGFGFSDRSNRVYSPPLFTEAILDLLRTQVREKQPADVVALSLSSEFAALAAQRQPELFRSLTLISPTGLAYRARQNVPQRASEQGASPLFYRVLTFPLWSQALYDLIASKPSIRFFLEQSFEGPADPDLIAYAYATSHRPGARYAPLYFISGQLFMPDIRERVYERLALPVHVIYDRDAFTSFDALPDLLTRCPNWQATRITPTRGLPHWERMGETAQAMDQFWQALEGT